MSAQPIPPKFVPKVWGSTELEPWFPNASEKIGEVWFPAGDLLIKFLFTSEALSVQVHPDDEYAGRCEQSLGKTEMWHILRAEQDSKVALGFAGEVAPEELRQLCESGAVMDRLAWRAARPGNTFFIPPGTVHAIGSGLVLCEVQQNSDVTYRMFDYGRPRELHLNRALDVASLGRFENAVEDGDEVVSCEYFRTSIHRLTRPETIPGDRYAVVLRGTGTIANEPFRPGTVWLLAQGSVEIKPERGEVELLLTGKP